MACLSPYYFCPFSPQFSALGYIVHRLSYFQPRHYGGVFGIQEERPIGVYGQRRRVYLKKHHRVLYFNLLTAGTLDGHLADIEEQAQELFLWLVKQYADTEGVTEAVKADDPMAWVRKMNGIRHRANEAVMQEIVYG